MGCLYRKENQFLAAGAFFNRAADSYARAYGAGDKRVSESTKRARMMAGKVAEGGGGGFTSMSSGLTHGAAAGGSGFRAGAAPPGVPASPSTSQLSRGGGGGAGRPAPSGTGASAHPSHSSRYAQHAASASAAVSASPSDGDPAGGLPSQSSFMAPAAVVRDTLRAASASANAGGRVRGANLKH